MQIKRDGNQVTLTFTLAAAPYVSKSEAAEALKKGRDPVARSLYSSGGFIPDGKGGKFSVNAITA